MNEGLKGFFQERWNKYFPGADLPVCFYYSPAPGPARLPAPAPGHRCMVCDLARARAGGAVAFDLRTIACSGGRRYLGFSQELMPGFEYFLSCGIPGGMDGERYIKTPELVKDRMRHQAPGDAPARYIVFKRWDTLEADDQPLAVIFFAPPDVLAGLFTLANYDEPEDTVIAPFGAGCASIVSFPIRELQLPRPRAVLGLFDVSARTCVPPGVLSFAVPWPKFERMAANMDESFLITASWDKVRSRLG